MRTLEQINGFLNGKLKGSMVMVRKQGGATLSYIEGWYAIAAANEAFGFDGWSRETVEIQKLSDESEDGKFNISYRAKVRVEVVYEDEKGKLQTVVREGCGAGEGIGYKRFLAEEMAIKEAETDATKRALMTFGWPLGLALYDKHQRMVDKS